MRCYFAHPRGHSFDVLALHRLAGMGNVLLSYAYHDSSPNEFSFWVNMTEAERTNQVKLFVAGNGRSPNSSQVDYDTGTRNRLLSYAFVNDWAKEEVKFWIENRPPHSSVLLDSGAFSLWRLGVPITLDSYCEYLERHKDALSAYIVLDVIKDLEGTKRNLKEMRRRGFDPLPVYHSDCEPISEWEEILAENTGYVCLGGLAVERPAEAAMRERLRRCWRVVEKHWPVKIHALGVTTQWIMEEFPFYSTDSSSAIRGAGMGSVQRFRDRRSGIERGRLTATGWRTDVLHFGDGAVVDGVGRVRDETVSRPSASAHAGRRIRNIQAQLSMERYLTDLWASRGVRWDE